MSVPGGWLVDHFDRRYLAAVSTLASAGFASTYPFLHSVWLLVGLGAAEAVTVAVAGPAFAAAACAQRSESPARPRPGSRLDGPDGSDRAWRPLGRGTVRAASLGPFRGGVGRDRRVGGSALVVLAGRARAGPSARTTRVPVRPALLRTSLARPGPDGPVNRRRPGNLRWRPAEQAGACVLSARCAGPRGRSAGRRGGCRSSWTRRRVGLASSPAAPRNGSRA